MPFDTVTNGYFTTLGIALTRGRLFAPDDTAAAPPRVVVNETFVRRFFPSEDPIGKRVTFSDPQNKSAQWLTIVGVVADTRVSHIGVAAQNEPPVARERAARIE